MPRLVISTVGTSLLTNQIDRDIDPNSWSKRLQMTANYTLDEIKKYHEDISHIIEELKNRAEEKLYDDDTELEEIRELSAELNGIYGIYDLHKEQLEQGQSDTHWLIATDTAQGQVTAEIVKEFLRRKGLLADIYTPEKLSTKSTESFSEGIDELLKWLDEIIRGYEKSHEICFNLVGGFKALQGYANTIGMLYGVEIIYVFEGSFEVITIPRLPIKVDSSVIKPVEFAMMAAGAWVKLAKLQDVPKTLILVAGDEATLSNWGRLTWNSCKQEFLAGDLLPFPRLVYEKSFEIDYKKFTGGNKEKVDYQKRIELQEKVAGISVTLTKFNGDTSRVDPRLRYTRYENKGKGEEKGKIDHFYVNNDGWRVSCILKKDGNLYLRHYGEHDYVNDNP